MPPRPSAVVPSDVADHLELVRAAAGWSILALHASISGVEHTGAIAHSGLVIMAHLGNPETHYWDRQGRPFPTELISSATPILKSKGDAASALNWAEQAIQMNMVARAYEEVNRYANTNGRKAEKVNEPWWRFATVLRNLINHDLTIRGCKEVPLPVAWRDLELAKAQEGQHLLTHQFFTVEHAFRLVLDMEAWVRADPADA